MARRDSETLESVMAELGMELPENPVEVLRQIKDIIQCVICQVSIKVRCDFTQICDGQCTRSFCLGDCVDFHQ